MRAGQLDRRLTLQRPGTVDDPVYGPQPGGWTDFAARIPAQKWDLLPASTEVNGPAVQVSGHPARVRIRYMRGVTSDMRVVMHEETDVVYEMTSTPAEIGRREWLEFTIGDFTS